MDINTLLTERMNFNNSLFSMSFPDIVNYIEKNPSTIPKVDWDLFTNFNIRISKNIDSYPELILRHPNWPWKFDIKQIQNELSRKISELNRLSRPSMTMTERKSNNDNWIDKVINSMEKLCEIQNKIKSEETKNILSEINQLKKEEKKEEKKEKKEIRQEIIKQNVMMQIANEEMPPEDVGEMKPEKFVHESDEESNDFSNEDPGDINDKDEDLIGDEDFFLRPIPNMDTYCARFNFFKK
jgi:hypothetical protein